MCDCITKMNNLLKSYDTMLNLSINIFDQTTPATVQIETLSIKHPHKHGLSLTAQYCPFCGGKYEKEKEEV